jgi:DUF3099 family protein
VRSHPSARRDQAYLVTEAPQSRAAEINQRQRRYLLMMGIRVVCFVVTVVMFLSHLGWFSLIPAVGAITMPYFAVVVANTRDPRSSSGFKPYEPNLPERYAGGSGEEAGQPGQEWSPGQATSGQATSGQATSGQATPGQAAPGTDDPRPGDAS